MGSSPTSGIFLFAVKCEARARQNSTERVHSPERGYRPLGAGEPGKAPLNFGGRKRFGAFGVVWPPATALGAPGFTGVRLGASTWAQTRPLVQPSTNRALRRLTSEVGRDPVHSTRYGRPPATVLGAPGFTGVRLGASTWAQTRPARRPATGAHARPQQAPTHATRDAP